MKELETITKLVASTPNDTALGAEIRKYITSVESNTNNFILCIRCGKWQSILNHNCKYCGKTL